MARPSKYNWKAIRKSYEDGFDINKLCDMYSIEKKTIQNRISSEKWEVTGNINTDINEKELMDKLEPIVTAVVEEIGVENAYKAIQSIIDDLKYLYIIKPKGLSYYKIGVAVDVDKRMKSLQTGCPAELHCIYKKEFNKTIKLERMIHKKYKNKNTYGEWFKFNKQELEELINTLEKTGFINGKTKI